LDEEIGAMGPACAFFCRRRFHGLFWPRGIAARAFSSEKRKNLRFETEAGILFCRAFYSAARTTLPERMQRVQA